MPLVLRRLAGAVAVAFATALAAPPSPGQQPAPVRATSLILVTLDGLRWQELFAGADSALLADTTASATGARRPRNAGGR